MEPIDKAIATKTYHYREDRHGGWGLLLMGGAVLMGLTFVPSGISFLDQSEGWKWLARLISFLTVAVSLAATTRQRVVHIDRRNRTVEVMGGWRRLGRSRSMSLDDIVEVRISKEITRSQDRSRTYYRLDLTGPGLAVGVWESTKYPQARAEAETLADFIHIPLRDNAAPPIYQEDGMPVGARAPHALDARVADQAVANGVPTSFPPPPEYCRIRVRREGDRVVFELPVKRHPVEGAVFMSAPLMAAAAGIAWVIRHYMDPSLPLGDQVLMYSLPAFAGIALPAAAIVRAINGRREEETIAVTPLLLSSEVRRCWTWRSAELPVGAIEELGYSAAASARVRLKQDDFRLGYPMSAPAIVARADFRSMTLGRGLFPAEQVWLHGALQYLLARADAQ